jgi:Fe-S-cluster-containing hydrogenase component 2
MIKKLNKIPNDSEAGVLTIERLREIPGFPDEKDFGKGLIAVIECDEDIPCNPCESICPKSAIKVGNPITNLPSLDFSKCSGCLKCLGICPGLCIFAVDKNFEDDKSLIYVPYEYSPLPQKGMAVRALDRKGNYACEAVVLKVLKPAKKQNSAMVGIVVPREFYNTVRHFEF